MFLVNAESRLAELVCTVFPQDMTRERAMRLARCHAGHSVRVCTVRMTAVLVLLRMSAPAADSVEPDTAHGIEPSPSDQLPDDTDGSTRMSGIQARGLTRHETALSDRA